MPTCCPRAWARSDNGLPFSHSTSWKTICPPSRIGIGNRLRNPSDREMSTRKPRNAATPASAESPANSAIDSGPLRFFSDTRPSTMRQNSRACSTLMVQASPPARASATAAPSSVCRSMLSG